MLAAALHDCCPEGHLAGWYAASSHGQTDIRDHDLFDVQLVTSVYIDCSLRNTCHSSILNLKQDTTRVIYKFISN